MVEKLDDVIRLHTQLQLEVFFRPGHLFSQKLHLYIMCLKLFICRFRVLFSCLFYPLDGCLHFVNIYLYRRFCLTSTITAIRQRCQVSLHIIRLIVCLACSLLLRQVLLNLLPLDLFNHAFQLSNFVHQDPISCRWPTCKLHTILICTRGQYTHLQL